MKKIILFGVMLSMSSLLWLSCTKNSEFSDKYASASAGVLTANKERIVKFLLSTDKSFSEKDGLITFTLVIRDSKQKVLWDSVLSPMRIKDIPAKVNQLEIVKSVPNNNRSLLQVGFLYAIENVGYSWHLDAFNEGEYEKVVDFNFH
jgi:hypothetical protein